MYERDVNEIKKLLSKSKGGDVNFNSLTEEEKMNIRKNLELYYKTRGEGETSITYNFATDEPLDTVETVNDDNEPLTLIKISDTYISQENLKGIYLNDVEYPINIDFENEDLYAVGPLVAANKDNVVHENIGPFSKGLWVVANVEEIDSITISYIGETDVYEKVPKEYLPDDIYPFNATIVKIDSDSYTSVTNFLSLKDAIISGRDIKINLFDNSTNNIIGYTKNVSFINNEIYIDFSKLILVLDSNNSIQVIDGHIIEMN